MLHCHNGYHMDARMMTTLNYSLTSRRKENPMMFWSDHDMSGWGYAGMAIGMVLFWVLIIVAIVRADPVRTGAA